MLSSSSKVYIAEKNEHEILIDQTMRANFNPILSIMIPTYNRPHLLKFAVDSILRQATSLCIEIVIVDNNPESTCWSQFELTHPFFPIKYIRNRTNLGMFGNWNKCLELARGMYVTILNDDDLMLEGCLSDFASLIESNIDFDYAEYGMKVFTGDSDNISTIGVLARTKKYMKELGFFARHRAFPKRVNVLAKILRNNRNGSLGIFYKTELVRSTGWFDESAYPSADYLFNINYLCSATNPLSIGRETFGYRISDNESAKPDVLAGFVCANYLVRTTYGSQFLPPILVKFFSWLSIYSDFACYEKYWKIKPCELKIQASLNRRIIFKPLMCRLAQVTCDFLYPIIKLNG